MALSLEGLLRLSTLIAEAHPPSVGMRILQLIPMIIVVFLIFYFLAVKPQQIEMRKHQEMVDSLKKGDQVVTKGGILGRVVDIGDDHVRIDVGGAKLRVLKQYILSKLEKAQEHDKK